ncbi:hypothetical protein LCM10_01990 [Rossellomorea aquimaris]|uniref:hypothetical protein n=1 Tax=Rossellomorea aquimaris TaxID=189382 RepID=UPI001CD479D5|nr:hypothetical protein [Rossellomorea aquimaris]MCA1053742.1 hypothetical protein [Rossellomorea aquimaris]
MRMFMRRKGLTIWLAGIILVTAMMMNSTSFKYAKNSCLEQHLTPVIKKDLFLINWSVSCE